MLNSSDELYALLTLLLERHYLKTYNSSFTEHFYGLKREKVLHIKGGDAPRARLGAPDLLRESLKLQERDIWPNLALLVGLPYIKRKLDESYEIHVPSTAIIGHHNRDALPENPTLWQRILYYYKWFLRKIYPSLNAAYYFALLAFNLAYLFSHTKHSSPFLYLLRTRLRRLSPADHRAIALAESVKAKPGARPGQGNSLFTPSNLRTTALSSLKLLLPTSIFLLKFLEWYHNSDFARQLHKRATEGLDLPPPLVSGLPSQPQPSPPVAQRTNTVVLSSTSDAPTLSMPTPSSSSKPRQTRPPISLTSGLPILTVPAPSATTSSLCPICLSAIVTPTATGTGYVYCYTCIFKWVRGESERQVGFMGGRAGRRDEGSGDPGVWDEDGKGSGDEEEDFGGSGDKDDESGIGRRGKWESGEGRDAVTGRRVLGGVEGLRRVMA